MAAQCRGLHIHTTLPQPPCSPMQGNVAAGADLASGWDSLGTAAACTDICTCLCRLPPRNRHAGLRLWTQKATCPLVLQTDACTCSSAALDPATGMQISLPMTMNPDGSYSLPHGGMMTDPSQPPQPYLPPYAQAQAATEEGGEGTQSQPDAGKPNALHQAAAPTGAASTAPSGEGQPSSARVMKLQGRKPASVRYSLVVMNRRLRGKPVSTKAIKAQLLDC